MKSLIKIGIVFIMVGLTSFVFGQEQQKFLKEKVQVVLVGTFHFANPGLDDHNIEVDDVYSENRQAEIAEMNQGFAAFNPDKIFLETDMADSRYYDSLYQAYLSGNFEIKSHKYGRSETFQVGFKLAKKLGHRKVFASDADGIWLGNAVRNLAKELGLRIYEDHFEEVEAKIMEEMIMMRKATMKEIIYHTNLPEELMYNHNFYIDVACRILGEDQGGLAMYYDEEKDISFVQLKNELLGPELTAEWYKRNIKIYANIMNQIEEGDKRIFVYYGQAHIRILQHLFEDNPNFEVVSALEYLK